MPPPQADALTAAYQRQQHAIALHVVRSATGLWREVDPRAVDRAWPAVSQAIAGVVRDGYASSTAQAAHYLRDHAAAAGVDLRGAVLAAPALPADQLDTALRVTGPVALKRAAGQGMSPDHAAGAALSQLAGSAGRLVLTGGRATIARTVQGAEQIAGWRRVIGGGACYFCAMLASRGAVYKDETRALFAGNSSHVYHDHCRCIPEPLYQHEAEPLEVDAIRRQYEHARDNAEPGQSTVAAFRAHYKPATGAALVELRAAEGVAAVTAAATAAKAAELTGLSDDDLAARLVDAGDDMAEMDRILAELDRRDAAAQAEHEAEAKRQRDRDRRDAKKAADYERRTAEMERRIAAGDDPQEAYAHAFGKDLEKVRRQEVIDELRRSGHEGVNFERLSAAAYVAEAEQLYIAAEAGTRGALLSHAGQRAGYDPARLFLTHSDNVARKYASEELKQWWDEHGGRLTLEDFRANLLAGRNTLERSAGDAWHQ